MTASEIRKRFVQYFERHGHRHVPSSSLVPRNDPTLLFTNAGMVQFKRALLGEEDLGFRRAVTSQKCLRVSGKHNDLEEVGVTRRHHTFFEMLGNFSFGDYFKRDAIRFAWELFTEEFGLARERLWVTVHYTDQEAAELWQEIAGLPAHRIFELGDKDNFWQMGETGPCGPCSEIHYDLRPAPEGGTDVTQEQFLELGENEKFLELWNLVFMQFDRAADGTLSPLPAPSIDTGAGLERVTSVLQGVSSNYETDLFVALIERAGSAIGVPYDAASPRAVSYRVLADHARAVAFLLADGVLPSNDGPGYVLRRILRRAVRHAWLLGRREPTLVYVAEAVIEEMGDAYPELRQSAQHIRNATRQEEERFLDTIDSGMARIDEIAPPLDDARRTAIARGEASPVIAGDEAFRLHDTFGFPLDLTELIARERGYQVDVAGYERALATQRARSRAARKAETADAFEFGEGATGAAKGWQILDEDADQEFVGYDSIDVVTDVIAVRVEGERAALALRQNPFYLEAGGQVSDAGVVEGDGWRVDVTDVRRLGGRVAAIGELHGSLPQSTTPIRVHAAIDSRTRHDTVRNHTATHLLHAALRAELGTHVQQRGSLVAPDRLRFDFAHTRPMTPDEIRRVEDAVNEGILEDHAVVIEHLPLDQAIARGAMALFGEKYGDVVRVVQVPGVSMELCGGTHARHTGEIGLFRIVSETGVAAGVRRIEAVTGTQAYRRAVEHEALLSQAAALIRTTPDALVRKLEQVTEENRELRRQLERARQSSGGDRVAELLAAATSVNGMRVVATAIEAENSDELRALGDSLRERLGSGAAILATTKDGRVALLCVVTDDLPGKGVRADQIVREVAAITGGSGGGKAHMAQGGAGDASKVQDALRRAPEIVRTLAAAGG
jgi:alanyl-tRNA synthetase